MIAVKIKTIYRSVAMALALVVSVVCFGSIDVCASEITSSVFKEMTWTINVSETNFNYTTGNTLIAPEYEEWTDYANITEREIIFHRYFDQTALFVASADAYGFKIDFTADSSLNTSSSNSLSLRTMVGTLSDLQNGIGATCSVPSTSSDRTLWVRTENTREQIYACIYGVWRQHALYSSASNSSSVPDFTFNAKVPVKITAYYSYDSYHTEYLAYLASINGELDNISGELEDIHSAVDGVESELSSVNSYLNKVSAQLTTNNNRLLEVIEANIAIETAVNEFKTSFQLAMDEVFAYLGSIDNTLVRWRNSWEKNVLTPDDTSQFEEDTGEQKEQIDDYNDEMEHDKVDVEDTSDLVDDALDVETDADFSVILTAIFDNSYVKRLMLISLGACLIGYVLYGKR